MADDYTGNNDAAEVVDMTVDIVAAYVRNNTVVPADLPQVIESVSDALNRAASKASSPQAERPKPAVPIRKSVQPDHIVCLEDGKKFKSLKRHLKTVHGLTPEEYREKWGLRADYPVVAQNYSAERSKLAKKLGLGRQAKSKTS